MSQQQLPPDQLDDAVFRQFDQATALGFTEMCCSCGCLRGPFNIVNFSATDPSLQDRPGSENLQYIGHFGTPTICRTCHRQALEKRDVHGQRIVTCPVLNLLALNVLQEKDQDESPAMFSHPAQAPGPDSQRQVEHADEEEEDDDDEDQEVDKPASPHKRQNPDWFETMQGDSIRQQVPPHQQNLDESGPAGLGQETLRHMAELASRIPSDPAQVQLQQLTLWGLHPEQDPNYVPPCGSKVVPPTFSEPESLQDLNDPGKDIGVLAHRMASPQLFFTLFATAHYDEKSIFGDFVFVPKTISGESQEQQALLPPPCSGFHVPCQTLTPNCFGLANFRNSPEYWKRENKRLESLNASLGPATFFVTLSDSSFQWTSTINNLIQVLYGYKLKSHMVEQLTSEAKYELFEKDPVQHCLLFHRRLDHILAIMRAYNWPFSPLVHTYVRTEFTAKRGTMHIRMLVWVKDAPAYPASLDDDGFQRTHQSTSLTNPIHNKRTTFTISNCSSFPHFEMSALTFWQVLAAARKLPAYFSMSSTRTDATLDSLTLP
ncbi:unnamed protein product, partial [Allacma fusca]